jgi:hypothetical protein
LIELSILKQRLTDLGRFSRYCARRFLRDGGPRTAAALSYSSLLALVPLLALFAALLSAFGDFDEIRQPLQDEVFDALLPEAARAVSDQLSGFIENARRMTGVGLLGLAVTAVQPFPSELSDFIVKLAGPHPLLLQIAGFHAFEVWQLRGGELKEGDCDHLRRRFVAEAEPHFEYYWRQLTEGDRYTLAALPLTQEDEARREAIRRLEQACLIRRTDQGHTYLSSVFEDFVRQQSVTHLLQLGPFLLDLSRRTALCHDAPLRVTKTEFKALAHLIRRAGQVVTPEELEKTLWGDEYVEDPDRVRSVIKSLRKALGDEAECLVTRWGVGYLFQVPC